MAGDTTDEKRQYREELLRRLEDNRCDIFVLHPDELDRRHNESVEIARKLCGWPGAD